MAVTDEQVAALRAYLTARTEDESKDAERGFLTLYRTDHLDGIGDLVLRGICGRRPAPVRPGLDVGRHRPFRGRLPLPSTGRSWMRSSPEGGRSPTR